MALWAGFMFIASAGTVVVTLVGVFYVRDTLHQTIKATEAAQDAVAVTREAAFQADRPWIKIELAVLDQIELRNGEVRITVMWKIQNVGRSPAGDFAINIIAAPFDLTPDAALLHKSSEGFIS